MALIVLLLASAITVQGALAPRDARLKSQRIGPWDRIKQKMFGKPKIKIPKPPKINIPKINIPKINIPKINIPKINIPKINIPKINIPNLPQIKGNQEILKKVMDMKKSKEEDLKKKMKEVLNMKKEEDEKKNEEKKKEIKKEKKEKKNKMDLDIDDNDENEPKKKEESSDRQYCDVVVKKEDAKVEIDKKMVDMKYLQGKLSAIATVQSKEKECALLELSKCSSTSRNILGRSAYLKSLNMNDNKIRFSFHFFVGINRELGLCSVRVATKMGKDSFEDREKVMSYFPSEFFDMNPFTNQKSFNKAHDVFEGKTTQQALEMCAQPFEKTQKMLISNFYQTFEGFLLSESQSEEIKFKCEKNVRQSEVLFRAINESGLKKVDVFVNNKDYTQIAIKAEQTKFKVSQKKIDENKRGGNLAPGVKTFSVQVFGLSNYNFHNNQCYDLDRKNVLKSWVKSSYNPSVPDSNSEFNFDVAVMAQEFPSGTMCAVYGLFAVPQEEENYFMQNDLLVKFKKESDPVTNDSCGTLLENLHDHVGQLEMFNSVENRFLGGAIINSLANPEYKLYCHIDVRDNIAKDQFRQDQYNRIFYETAVTQFVDNNNEDKVNSALQSQLDAIQKRIAAIQENQAVLPTFYTLPFDLTTRKDVPDTLQAGQTLVNMDFLRSKNGLFSLVMKADGNLCIYLIQSKEAETKKVWCSGTGEAEQGKAVLKLAPTGEVAVINSANQAKLFAPNQAGSGSGFFLVMQDDGNLCVYNSENAPAWCTNTEQNDKYFSLKSALISNTQEEKHPRFFGPIVRSLNGKFMVQLQQNGELAIMKAGQKDASAKAIWSNSMEVESQYKFTMHLVLDEGNLVEYADQEQKMKVWESNTVGSGATKLVITDEGAMELQDDSNTMIWNDSMMPNDLWSGPTESNLDMEDSLKAQQFLRSENGNFVCILRDNLELQVLMKVKGGEPKQIWSSGQKSSGQNLGKLSVNEEAQVVVMDTTENKAIFTSENSKKSGEKFQLRVLNDGTLKVFNEQNEEQWTTPETDFKTISECEIPSEVEAPFSSFYGYFLMSPGKKCMARLDLSGKILLVDESGKKHWVSDTSIAPINYFTQFVSLAEDGEFSMFTDEKNMQWSAPDSKQDAPKGYKMSLGDDCTLEVKDKAGEVSWNPVKVLKNMFTNSMEEIKNNQQTLKPNECMNDKQNMFATCMTPSGNLLISIKQEINGTPRQLWESKTECAIPGACVLKVKNKEMIIQDIYEDKVLKKFASGMDRLLMQCDGNLVGYTNWNAKWSSQTYQDANKPWDTNALPSKVVKPHTFFMGGAIMASPNKQYNLMYQWDGNVVLKRSSSPIGITGKINSYQTQFDQFFILQGDGNLVQYLTNPNTRPIWATGKMSGHSLQLTDSGRLEVLDDKDTVIWSMGFNRRFQKHTSHNETIHSHHNETTHGHHNVTDHDHSHNNNTIHYHHNVSMQHSHNETEHGHHNTTRLQKQRV